MPDKTVEWESCWPEDEVYEVFTSPKRTPVAKTKKAAKKPGARPSKPAKPKKAIPAAGLESEETVGPVGSEPSKAANESE